MLKFLCCRICFPLVVIQSCPEKYGLNKVYLIILGHKYLLRHIWMLECLLQHGELYGNVPTGVA